MSYPERYFRGFWSKVEMIPFHECWEWIGLKRPTGYGLIYVGYRMEGAHRFSWEIHNGEIPKKMCVCHKCDNPSCVNPKHLFLGSMRENMLDRNKKGRHAKGEKMGSAKLTQKQVLEIREKYKPYKYTTIRLAKEYNVNCSSINLIINRKIWKHI